MKLKPLLFVAAALGVVAYTSAGPLRAEVLRQQDLAAQSRGPLVHAWQEAGLEVVLEAPRLPTQQGRHLAVLLRNEAFSRYDPDRFGTVFEVQLLLNDDPPRTLTFVDSPPGEADAFEVYLNASDFDFFSNSAIVLVRNTLGQEISFVLSNVF